MKILMVCLGNICRSPLAQGILEDKIKATGLSWTVDSSGTSAWHVGELPDSRSIQTANANGIDITDQRARQFVKNDFDDFDLILAMDVSNYNNVLNLAVHENHKSKVKMILNYAYPGENRSVPDPYYDNGFERVYEMLNLASDHIIEQHK